MKKCIQDTNAPVKIGSHQLTSNVFLAPMAGVADKPFRKICKAFGAGLTTTEMAIVRDDLLDSFKSKTRLDFSDEKAPISVQIAGATVEQFVHSAKFVAQKGADIIDLNMGCPAKKVCQKAAGSALLQNERLVADILSAVIKNVSTPITLKIRTGVDKQNRNALAIAKIAQDCGIQLLVIHGRTKADKYKGNAEYDTIAEVVQSVNIPVIANGDITSATKAKTVLDYTNAKGVMIGRSAQGRPWLIQEIVQTLTEKSVQKFSTDEKKKLIFRHIKDIYKFYGDLMGVRLARKHIFWYAIALEKKPSFWQQIQKLNSAQTQYNCLKKYL